MAQLTWEHFKKRIYINTSLEKLYWCWATQEGITAWFLKDCSYQRNGEKLAASEHIKAADKYTWYWHNWDGKEEGQILDANNKDYIKFSFAGSCEVTINMEQQQGVVLLTLTQSKIPLDDKSKLEIFYGCSNGWTFWLANLKAYLEHNILLNETEIDLRPFGLAGYEFVNM
ncbi:SRPBCC family protein [Mangrovimonas yunxiaonensis]|uniref:SRPBCC family protein n=1 Tax=Mangrovimonas yunxiaonensis TaxID=1197477 RepID=UPI000690CB18|nr:SRPBCC domain-containing protein [Mangrovimonas yunxiaonensis]MBR9757159.1 SRPBCC domain-containing protein [Algicola sp.]GGH47275.1 hypothetical protein GCM10011364_21990 [Mangrovimonas yunxiaonensis]